MQKSYKKQVMGQQRILFSIKGWFLIAIFLTFFTLAFFQQHLVLSKIGRMIAHSETIAIETTMSDIALRDVASFNPEKRTAFFLVLSQENGYEDRFRKHLILNESDKFLARNELMRSFLTARQISPASQESLANLFDALDASISQEYALENRQMWLTNWSWIVGFALFIELIGYIRAYVF